MRYFQRRSGSLIAKRGEEVISGQTYRKAGVDIDAGNRLVEALKPLAGATGRPGTMGQLGGFGAFFDPKAAGFEDPILVAATDGVGTKLKIAIDTGRHGTIGIDLVAMCVNDLIVQGAEPLFFLDYFATGKLSPEVAAAVVEGIADGCRQAACALIGGETAEMPGMYGSGDYDLAGFAVGAVEREGVLTGENVSAGDVVLGLASSGPHSNGYSLIRRVAAAAGLAYGDPAPFAGGGTLGERLLEPTRIYVRPILAAIRTGGVHALAHITGGGLVENLPRVLPAGTRASIVEDAWVLPPVFRWLAEAGDIAPGEMIRTFNCGIGMTIVAAVDRAGDVRRVLEEAGETVFHLGVIESAAPGDPPSVAFAREDMPWAS